MHGVRGILIVGRGFKNIHRIYNGVNAVKIFSIEGHRMFRVGGKGDGVMLGLWV